MVAAAETLLFEIDFSGKDSSFVHLFLEISNLWTSEDSSPVNPAITKRDFSSDEA